MYKYLLVFFFIFLQFFLVQFVFSQQRAIKKDSSPLPLFTQSELIIKSGQSIKSSINVSESTSVSLSLLARRPGEKVAGLNPYLFITVNGKPVTAENLINKPPRFTSSRFPEGFNLVFRNKSFQIYIAPSFDPLPGNNIYVPKEYSGITPYEFVFNISGLLTSGQNIIEISNSCPENLNLDILIRDAALIGNTISVLSSPSEKKNDSGNAGSAPAEIRDIKKILSSAKSSALFSENEIFLPSQKSITAFIQKTENNPAYIRLLSRREATTSAGMNNYINISVNGTAITPELLINKPHKVTSKRFPDGFDLFLKNSYYIMLAPSFDPIADDNIYKPYEYSDMMPYEFVFDITKLLMNGVNRIRILNSSRLDQNCNIVLKDAQIFGDGLTIDKNAAENYSKKKADIPVTAKRSSVFLPPAKAAVIKQNIQKFTWAQEIRDSAVSAADKRVQLGLEFWWRMVIPNDITKSGYVNKTQSCPNCGKDKIQRFGSRNWIFDYTRDDWKITCPNCGESFPKNDFKTFYESGLDASGVFHVTNADVSLLYNPAYSSLQDKNHKKWVDDGTGFASEKYGKEVFLPIAYYGLWARWIIIRDALKELTDAYMYTGDIKYARTAFVIVDRLADLYPSYDYPAMKARIPSSRAGTVPDFGVTLDYIWESWIAQNSTMAYDVCFDAVKNDPELIKFLAGMRKKFPELTPKHDFAGVTMNIQRNLIWEIINRVKKGDIFGNEGFYQKSIIQAAIVSQSKELLDDAQNWCLNPFAELDKMHLFWQGHWERQGHGLIGLFFEAINGDGISDENSMGYNTILNTSFIPVVKLLSEAGVAQKDNLFLRFPVVRPFTDGLMHYQTVENGYPHFGDSGSTSGRGKPGWYIINRFNDWNLLELYRIFNDDAFLRYYYKYFLDMGQEKNIPLPLDTAEPEKLLIQMKTAWKEKGWPLKVTANGNSFLPNEGAVIVRQPNSKNKDSGFYFVANGSDKHGHKGVMNIGIYRSGVNLMPEMGYPEFTGRWPKRIGWTGHTISHNTVMVDKNPHWAKKACSQPVFYFDSPELTCFEFNNPWITPAKLFSRTIAVIKINDEDFYVFDLFRIDGGTHHLYSLHGYDGKADVHGLSLTLQNGGTLAGKDIAYGALIPGEEFDWEKGSGFAYLDKIRKQKNPPSSFSAEWDIIDYYSFYTNNQSNKNLSDLDRKPYRTGTTLKFIYAGDSPAEAVFATGYPPIKPVNPPSLEYLILTRENSSALRSVFAGTIEGFKNKPHVQTVRQIPLSGSGKKPDYFDRAYEVTLSSGRIDYLFFSMNPSAEFSVLNKKFIFSGRMGLVTVINGKPADIRLIAGSVLTCDGIGIKNQKAVHTGKIKDFSTDAYSLSQWVLVEGDFEGMRIDDLSYLSVDNKIDRPAYLKIEHIEKKGTEYLLHLGNTKLVKGLKNRFDPDLGFEYILHKGDSCEVSRYHTFKP